MEAIKIIKQMKKIFLLTVILCATILNAQTPTGRTVATVVADVLAQLPAAQQRGYEQSMRQLVDTGEEGIKLLVSMLHAPGKGDNSAVDYALSGMAHFASNDEAMRNKTELAFLAALDATNEPETKAFLIRQLVIVGSNVSINKLSAFLTDDKFCNPAAGVLVAIGGEQASKALLTALMRRDARSTEAQRTLIQALGEIQPPTAGTEELLKTLLNANDATTQKIVLKALSRTGTKNSLPDFAALVASKGYKAELTDAGDAYIALIKRVYEQGDKKIALSAAQTLLQNATKAGATHLRIPALEILFYDQKNVRKTLITALKDENKAYRNAALHFASAYADKAMYTEIFKTLPKAKTPEKIDRLYWIGIEASCPEKRQILKTIETGIDKSGMQTLVQMLRDSDVEVKQAATIALGAIGNPEALPALAEMLKSTNTKILSSAKSVFASFPDDISPALARVFGQASEGGKIAILELLSGRKANTYFNLVLEQTQNDVLSVKNVAYKTLKDVVSEKDFVVLCGRLETSDPSFVAPLQQAVIATLASIAPDKQLEMITSRMLQAGDAKKYLYYPVLASTNVPPALKTILQGFTTGSGAAKEAAFEALLSWRGFEAEEALYEVCKNASSQYVERAVSAYITMASNETMTGDNRLIFLRKAMEVATTDRQKINILRAIRRTGTFLAMIYAGEFLDETVLKENAAQAVMEIALANKNFTGSLVRELLTKTAAALSGIDADYQRQAIRKHLEEMPNEAGFVSIFNGKDLTGWKGLVENPIKRAAMKPADLKAAQAKADAVMRSGWAVVNGQLVFNGKGDNICTEKLYGDIEMYVDWKLDPAGPEPDAGIYLRGTPQVQIWDTSRVKVGAQVGSGGLYNNQTHPRNPLKVADNKLGEWNTFYIKMTGDRVTVWLNGVLVVNNVILENFWDRKQPIPPIEQIELQAHGSKVYYRNIYVKEIERPEPFQLSAEEKKEGYQILFDGTNMYEWTGNLIDYKLEDGCISLSAGSGGNLYTKKEFDNFIFRFEFQLTPAANNGVGIRTPLSGDAAYIGMEIQILDSEHQVYRNLQDYQYHGSVYGVIPAKRGFLKPVGEWNYQEILADGNHIKVTLNGTVILDGDLKEAAKNGTIDKREHPGLFNKSGHIGFLGHDSPVKFRNIRIKELK